MRYADLEDDPEEAIKAINETLGLIDEIEEDHYNTWARGEEFFTSVRDGLTDMRSTIEERGTVSAKQAHTICNWNSGVCKWHPDHK